MTCWFGQLCRRPQPYNPSSIASSCNELREVVWSCIFSLIWAENCWTRNVQREFNQNDKKFFSIFESIFSIISSKSLICILKKNYSNNNISIPTSHQDLQTSYRIVHRILISIKKLFLWFFGGQRVNFSI